MEGVHHIGFRLSDNPDPEERLEEAALWKAMYDHFGPDRISPLLSDDVAPGDWVLFGRQMGRFQTGQEPVSDDLPYWTDPAFLAHCGRSFSVVDYEGIPAAVERLHEAGRGVFLKSTRLKHWKAEVPVGTSVWDALGDMAYSFMDGGPHVMVQEAVDMTYERRYFVIGRRVVASSPVMNALTPIDWPTPYGACYRTPTSAEMEILPSIHDQQDELVERVAVEMRPEHAVVDIAMVGGRGGHPVVIEMNPMVLGQAGLFASSVRSLSVASEVLLKGFVPNPRPAFTAAADEGGFLDGDVADWSDDRPSGPG
jgi:hypothetical protein